MRASAPSERNDVTLPSGAQHPPAAPADSVPRDAETNAPAGPKSARPATPGGSKAAAARPDAPEAPVKKPAAAKPPAPPANGTDSAVQCLVPPELPEPAAPDSCTPSIKPAETLAAQDISSPSAAPAEAKPQDAKTPDVKTAEAKTAEPRPMNGTQGARPVMPVRPLAKEENFVEGDYVVYPTHGVGKVEKIAVEDIAGHHLELIHITFEENRMTLRVPVAKARTAGLRKLATQAKFDEALAVLRGRARIKRTMWSRRAQEYEAKINSGDPIAIAEVVRDLHRNAGQPDQSFSERQIYESAMDRLAAELAALDATDKLTAAAKLVNFLKAA